MCWRVWYVYKCHHDSTTTYKCLKCDKGDTFCLEANAPEICQLEEEICHSCSNAAELLAGDLTVDLSLRDHLVRPLETNFLANRPPRTYRRVVLRAGSPQQT